MNEKNVKEAIECVKEEIRKQQQEFDKAGEKRLTSYRTYAVFYIKAEMIAVVHRQINKEILAILETSSEPIEHLQQYQDRLQREVMQFYAPSSTSQTSNMFEVISHGVQLEYVRDSYGQINSILRVLSKKEE